MITTIISRPIEKVIAPEEEEEEERVVVEEDGRQPVQQCQSAEKGKKVVSCFQSKKEHKISTYIERRIKCTEKITFRVMQSRTWFTCSENLVGVG